MTDKQITWRKKHPRCRYCKNADRMIYCRVKRKYRFSSYDGMFCKLFEVEEY